MRSPTVVAVTLCIAALGAAACATSGKPTSTATGSAAPVRPTLTAPALQPPAQHNSPGNKDVVFDPCTWIDDATITKAGFDPRTRARGEDLVGEDTAFVCTFNSKKYGLALSSSNRTLDSFRADRKITNITVDGRAALEYPSMVSVSDCHVTMQSSDGVFDVQLETNNPGDDPCADIKDIASILATALPKG